jgi:hypothetical protein
MRRIMFNLALLLLVVVLVASLGAPEASASILPVTSPGVSQVTAEDSIVDRAAGLSTQRADRLFEVWSWAGTATSPSTMPRPGGDLGRLGQAWAF